MKSQKYYIYGIMPPKNIQDIQIKGLFDEKIIPKEFQKINLILSTYPAQQDIPVLNSRQNMLTHQKVVEYFFEQNTMIPTQFGTLMTETEIDNFLQNNIENLEKILLDFEGKGEVVLKGFWKDMPTIFKDIAENTPKITQYKQKIQDGMIAPSQNNLVQIGQMVEEELLKRKQKIEDFFYEELSNISHKIIKNQFLNDAMCINMAFLIDRTKEVIFDEKIQKLTDEWDKDIKFQFFAIAAPVHFIQIETN
jgi:hypothetical protein